ncbi:hypothetical protein PENTCL1PPCAC_26571, partial [Pristionchus entomophagus]
MMKQAWMRPGKYPRRVRTMLMMRSAPHPFSIHTPIGGIMKLQQHLGISVQVRAIWKRIRRGKGVEESVNAEWEDVTVSSSSCCISCEKIECIEERRRVIESEERRYLIHTL